MKMKKCANTLPSCVDSVIESSRNNNGVHVSSDGLMMDHMSDTSVMGHVSCVAEPRYDFHTNTSAHVNRDVLCADDSQDVPVVGKESLSQLSQLMKITYGDTLMYSEGGSCDFPWCQHWSVIIQHLGQHYSLPGGSISKCYVELLCDELQYFSLDTYRSERLIVFCSLMLQSDHLVCKGCDIHCLLDHHMKLWRDEQFDVLLQEAVRCDQSLGPGQLCRHNLKLIGNQKHEA